MKRDWIVVLCASVPYVLVAWGFTGLTDGAEATFWIALGVLLGFRLFFAVVETLARAVVWRAHGRKAMIKRILNFLRAHEFPKRKFRQDNIGNYLHRIASEGGLPESVRLRAQGLQLEREAAESYGMLAESRFESALNAALDIYSPREDAPNAPPFTPPDREQPSVQP